MTHWAVAVAVGTSVACGTSRDITGSTHGDSGPQAVLTTIESAESDWCFTDEKTTYVLARDPDADVTAIDLERDGQPEAVLRGDEAHLRLLDEQWVSVPLQDPGPGFVFFASTSLYKQVEGVFKIHLQEADFVGNIRDRIAKNPTNPQRFSEGDVDYPFMLSWESDGDDLISWSVERSTMEDLYPGDVWRMEYKLLDQAVAEELTGYDTGSPPSLAGLPARSVFPELSMTAPECVASPAQGAELLSCLQASAGDKTVAEWIERYGPGTSTRVESLPAECM